MKRIIFTAGLLSLGLFAQAQQNTKVDSTFLKNWMHSDLETTGVYGVNTMKAKKFLEEKNRKAFPLVVGVLDSGVEYFHEDLKNNMWVNPKEKDGNKKDDDKNGYIDDIHGWNFLTDKNGSNYAPDSYELTRQYKKLQDYFNSGATASSAPEKYADYLKLKKDYYTTIYKYELNSELAKTRMNYLSPRLEALNQVFGQQILTKSLVENFTTENAMALEGLFIFKELPATSWENKKIAEVTKAYQEKMQTALNNSENSLKYAYNLNYNPQEGIGKIYGNNDVKGLSDDHGTHVSGIIAAEWDNGKGMMGTGGGNNIKIMGVRVVPDGDERDQDIANGIRYAVDNGAKILNMSFGKSYDDNHKLVVDAFKYAESKNVLIVKAAGNDNMDVDVHTKYPLTLINDKQYSPTTITVGANTRFADNLRARFSNWGKKSVDVFGPGTEIYATFPEGKYKFLQGTSMASPAVAGVAALVWSHYPKLTAKDIKNILIETVNKNDQLKDISVSGGVVDTYKAVQKAEELYKQRKLK
jgi:subtilisin family serine protease